MVEALGVTALIYSVAIVMPRWLPRQAIGMFGRTLCAQGLMLGLSLLAMSVLGRKSRGKSWRAYGFQGPLANGRRSWIANCGRSALVALALGAATTGFALLAGSGGHPALQAMRPAQYLLVAMVLAPITEEVLCRGFLQGHWPQGSEWLGLGSGIWVSAGVFAAMHLTLFGRMDAAGATLIVIMALLLGLLAGRERQRSGSLLPPILLHLSANLGGMLAGAAAVGIRLIQARGLR